MKLSGAWLSRGSHGVYMAVTGSMWLLQGICRCYGVYVLLFFTIIGLRGSYGTILSKGVTPVLDSDECSAVYIDLQREIYPIA